MSSYPYSMDSNTSAASFVRISENGGFVFGKAPVIAKIQTGPGDNATSRCGGLGTGFPTFSSETTIGPSSNSGNYSHLVSSPLETKPVAPVQSAFTQYRTTSTSRVSKSKKYSPPKGQLSHELGLKEECMENLTRLEGILYDHLADNVISNKLNILQI